MQRVFVAGDRVVVALAVACLITTGAVVGTLTYAEEECTSTHTSFGEVVCTESGSQVILGTGSSSVFVLRSAELSLDGEPFIPITLEHGPRGGTQTYAFGSATYTVPGKKMAQKGTIRAKVCTLLGGKAPCLRITQPFKVSGTNAPTPESAAKGMQPCHSKPDGTGVFDSAFLPARTSEEVGRSTTSVISVYCDGTKVKVVAGNGRPDQYIYKWGYEVLGGTLKRTFFTGSRTSGDWFIGSAEFEVSSDSGQKGRVVALVCTRTSKDLSCGCTGTGCARAGLSIQGFDVGIVKNDTPKVFGEGAVTVDSGAYYAGVPGGVVTLVGSKFTNDGAANTITFANGVSITSVRSLSPRTLPLTIPSLVPGKYLFRVSNKYGFSEDPAALWVLAQAAQPPVIDRVVPSKVRVGEKVTIYGKGFSPTGNELNTSLGIIPDLKSSNGTTIVFTFDPIHTPVVDFRDREGRQTKKEQEVYGRVYTTGGRSEFVRLTTVTL
jgi:hypothetical protein